MSMTKTHEPTLRKPLRLWPGVVIAIVLVLARYVVPLIAPDAEVFSLPVAMIAVLAGMLCAVAIPVWWMFFSRAPWSERLGALVLMIVAVFATRLIVHESIRGGMMGMMLVVYSIPVLSLALVVWAVATRRLAAGARRAAMVVTILLACGVFTLLRTGGMTGEGDSDLHWRWTKTPEERLLARAADEPFDSAQGRRLDPSALRPAQGRPELGRGAASSGSSRPSTSSGRPEPVEGRAQSRDDAPRGVPTAAPPAAPAAPPPDKPVVATSETAAEPKAAVASRAPAPAVVKVEGSWPGFRGPQRDGVVRGVRVATDWTRSKPVQLWRRPIGPGWSSFAVRGDLVYTQEQRGEHEVVSCYRLSTGEPAWRHRDAVRFYESNAGPGPRSTPTIHNGRVYTLGATGIVNALDASNGTVVWSRNAQMDTGAPLPGWGFAGSPLVVEDLVIVATSGRLAGYDAATGNPRWTHRTGGGGYSSPHLATIDGVPQILLLSGGGATSVSPADGMRLWQHPGPEGDSIVQPAFAAAGDVLVALADMMGGAGIRRIAVSQGPSGWTVEERWTSRGLKPYFNDFVVHRGHAFGFDGTILSCINLENGERKWKGGRYGAGQMVLLPNQDVLLVLSEEGDLALVSATPDKFTELARFKAIEGKTWNHPVLVGDVLLVRNGEEMAAFRLSVAGS
jgi:outer membrane protein assembly factor BamB